jgi:hypothetical protein
VAECKDEIIQLLNATARRLKAHWHSYSQSMLKGFINQLFNPSLDRFRFDEEKYSAINYSKQSRSRSDSCCSSGSSLSLSPSPSPLTAEART